MQMGKTTSCSQALPDTPLNATTRIGIRLEAGCIFRIIQTTYAIGYSGLTQAAGENEALVAWQNKAA
jgi:hypothetical protein